MSGVEVIVNDSKSHPHCPHGPTILFSRLINGKKRNFFACSACRDRKLCSFFLYEDEADKFNKNKVWDIERKKFTSKINHRKLFLTLNEIKKLPEAKRGFCQTCSSFELEKFWDNHADHKLITGVSDFQISRPSEFLAPIEDSKKEAQFLFSKSCVKAITNILLQLNFTKVISLGTPRIHEFILNSSNLKLTSLLLDFDQRFHHFYGPLEFCWFNMFNNHFFFDESQEVFNDFLISNRTDKNDLILVLDPPFGGRIEPLAHTIKQINETYKKINKTTENLPVFFIFPYFMEPQILNSLPDFQMLDYKVDYENHPLFQTKTTSKARKLGSPVRIFTNLDPSRIHLAPEDGYKYCNECEKWVYNENKHCSLCKKCTSKDGSTYVHCPKCKRCVKPTWKHCEKCERCAQPDHKCEKIAFLQECFHCKQPGHKKRDCPSTLNHETLHKKRKLGLKTKKPAKKTKLNRCN